MEATEVKQYTLRASTRWMFPQVTPENEVDVISSVLAVNGGLSASAEELADLAKPESHVLHGVLYDLSGDELVHEHAVQRARVLLGSIVQVTIQDNGVVFEGPRERLHVRETEVNGGCYEPRAVVLADSEKRARYINQGVTRLRAFIREFGEFEEFSRTCKAAQKDIDSIDKG